METNFWLATGAGGNDKSHTIRRIRHLVGSHLNHEIAKRFSGYFQILAAT
jgi:hypothetical protein